MKCTLWYLPRADVIQITLSISWAQPDLRVLRSGYAQLTANYIVTDMHAIRYAELPHTHHDMKTRVY